jgi:hypothetical protein
VNRSSRGCPSRFHRLAEDVEELLVLRRSERDVLRFLDEIPVRLGHGHATGGRVVMRPRPDHALLGRLGVEARRVVLGAADVLLHGLGHRSARDVEDCVRLVGELVGQVLVGGVAERRDVLSEARVDRVLDRHQGVGSSACRQCRQKCSHHGDECSDDSIDVLGHGIPFLRGEGLGQALMGIPIITL